MNKTERNTIMDLKVLLAEVRTDIKYIRRSVKEHNGKLDGLNDKVIVVENNLENHLKSHEQLRKETWQKMGLVVSIIGMLTAMLTSVVLKIMFG